MENIFNMRDINSIKGNEVVNCKTKEESIKFCKLLDEAGLKLLTGNSYSRISWHTHGENTCYDIAESGYANINYYINETRNQQPFIITSSEVFTTNQELKDTPLFTIKIVDE